MPRELLIERKSMKGMVIGSCVRCFKLVYCTSEKRRPFLSREDAEKFMQDNGLTSDMYLVAEHVF